MCARRLDRRLLGPNEGRRREAKDDVVPGWRDSYRREGGVDTGTSKSSSSSSSTITTTTGKGGEGGGGRQQQKEIAGGGMITGYHISGPLLRVLRVSPFFSNDPSPSSFFLRPTLYQSAQSFALCLRVVYPRCSSPSRAEPTGARSNLLHLRRQLLLLLPLRLRL